MYANSAMPLYQQGIYDYCSGEIWTKMKPQGDKGQTTLEFLIVAVVFMAVLVMLSLFLYTFKEYGGRILDLVASEYP